MTIVKRFIDISSQANRKGFTIFGDFLNINEISLLQEKKADYLSAFSLYGGYIDAERQMVAFYPEDYTLNAYTNDYDSTDISEANMYPPASDFPIQCLHLVPVNKKYADELSHRDVLGAIMHLGLERNRIGDILLQDNDIYVFCHISVSELLQNELFKIKHTIMRCEILDTVDVHITPQFEVHQGFVASNRLDALVACICNLSRNKSAEMILGERVFINGRLTTNHNQKLEPGDILSLRGFGKVRFNNFCNTTKKRRLRITYDIYK